MLVHRGRAAGGFTASSSRVLCLLAGLDESSVKDYALSFEGLGHKGAIVTLHKLGSNESESTTEL